MLSRSLAMVLLVLALAGITKAGMHFLRLVILAAAGLAGMWMVHQLAQDYNKITSQRPGRLFKRSMEDVLHSMDWERLPPSNRVGSQPPTFLDFQRILNMDPKGCARRLVCELATRPTEKLAADEANILLMIREGFPNQRYDRARETFQLAVNLGFRSKNQSMCHQKFKKCPFTTSQMLKIMRLPL